MPYRKLPESNDQRHQALTRALEKLNALPAGEQAPISAETQAALTAQQPVFARELLTDAGFTGPASTATYKVFTILESGAESGSEAVGVTWVV